MKQQLTCRLAPKSYAYFPRPGLIGRRDPEQHLAGGILKAFQSPAGQANRTRGNRLKNWYKALGTNSNTKRPRIAKGWDEW